MTDNQGPSLFRPVPEGGDWHANALLGGDWEADMPLGYGFLDAADILLEQWKQHRPDDLLVLPILYNYRHGIELTLKRTIDEAIYCARRAGVSSWWDTNEEVEKRLYTHKIADLVRYLNECLNNLPGFQGDEDAQLGQYATDVLADLHAIDETGC